MVHTLTDPENPCKAYDMVARDLEILRSSGPYIDRRGGLTSEGKALLAIIRRFLAINRLACIEIAREAMMRPEKLESLYTCIEEKKAELGCPAE